jgi:hypothetical protein
VEVRSAEADAAAKPVAAKASGATPSALDACAAHRLELARRLCAGRRVAVIGGPAEADVEGTEQEEIGIAELLAGQLDARFDSIAILDPEIVAREREATVEALQAQAASGRKLVVCSANPLIEADSPPGIAAPIDSPVAPLSELPEAVTMHQFAAEGSLIRSGEAAELDADLTLPEHGEREYANYVIVCVNFDPGVVQEARMELRVAPRHNRELRNLERANRELRSANAALARGWLGKRDTASASLLNRLREAETERDAVLGSLSWKITAPLRAFKVMLAPIRERRRRRREAARF